MIRHPLQIFSVAVAALLLPFLPNVANGGAIYNNAADFSATSNAATNAWTYGYLAPGATPAAATFTLYTAAGPLFGVDAWSATPDEAPPLVFHNPNASAITIESFITLQAGEAAFHPGRNGTYSVYRFTTPVAGIYSVTALFSGLDFGGPTSTDVHILDNGTEIFGGNINGSNVPGHISGTDPTASYSSASALSLVAGETLDFVVGYGSDETFDSDSTGLDATITQLDSPVPEPSSLLVFVVLWVMANVGARFHRRRQKAGDTL